jgi:3-polyprenyl-4-hydroxybenzoate decarboxylase
MAKSKPAPRPKILEPLLIEAGAKAASEIKGLTWARRLEANPQRGAQARAAAAEVQDVARSRREILKLLGSKGILRDPESSLGPALGAMPGSPVRYVTPTPEVTAWVLSTLEKRGLIKDGVMRLGSLRINPRAGVVLLSEALAYSAPGNLAAAARRVNTRGGVFYEMLMPFHEKVIVEETRVASQEAERIIRVRGQAAGLGAGQIEAQVSAVRETVSARMAGMSRVAFEGEAVSRGADGVALMDSGRVAEGLWMVRMTTMRDVNGKLVADHFRALVSFEKDVTRLVPIGLGESKFRSGAGKIVPQMIETVARVSDGVTAANLPRTGKVEVQWGSEVIAVIQSEEPPPTSHFEDLAQRLSAEAGSPVRATPIPMVNKQGADDAREIVKAVLDELRARSAKTKPPPKP